MSFHALAYGPSEHVLLTLDGGDLLAHDAHTEAPKWHLSFELPLVAVTFVDSNALPGGGTAGGASPRRSASSGRCVVVVDSPRARHRGQDLSLAKRRADMEQDRPTTTIGGLLHYDGKTWTTTTAFTNRAIAIGGTKTHVFLSVSSY